MRIVASAGACRRQRTLWACTALVLGIGLRFAGLGRPIDHHSHSAWREADVGMMARNFHREGMNVFYPRIDWRGDGPGYVEAEFPLQAWLMAVVYHVTGEHVVIGRALSLAASLGALAVFFVLARQLLPARRAMAAGALFALSPIPLRLATSLQPDGGMLLALLLSVWFFLRWQDSGRTRDAVCFGTAGGLAILLKLPALYLGPLFAWSLLHRHGLRALHRRDAWLAAALMLLPPLAWYAHAHTLWLQYGNSLGLSDETHWIGLDMLQRPHLLWRALRGLLDIELRYVFGGVGVLAAVAGLFPAGKSRGFTMAWAAAAAVFFLVALRTAGDDWAYYYHVLAVPPACLLMARAMPVDPHAARPHRGRFWLETATLAAFAAVAVWAAGLTGAEGFESRYLHGLYASAPVFKPHIPRHALVATLGANHSRDETGRPAAHNESPLLYWLDRRGFTLPRDRQTLDAVLALRTRGAAFAVCEHDAPVAPALQTRCPVVARTPTHLLLDLARPGS